MGLPICHTFQYHPRIQDVLAGKLPSNVIEQLHRRDNDLEDYLNRPPQLGANAGQILALAELRHATTDTTLSTSSTTFTDLDATNLVVTFTVPSSGAVLLSQTGVTRTSGTSLSVRFNARDSVGNVAGTEVAATVNSNRVGVVVLRSVSCLTPGAVLTWKWGWRVSASGTGTILHGPTFGAILMQVIAL